METESSTTTIAVRVLAKIHVGATFYGSDSRPCWGASVRLLGTVIWYTKKAYRTREAAERAALKGAREWARREREMEK